MESVVLREAVLGWLLQRFYTRNQSRVNKATKVLLLKQFLVYVREGCVIHRLNEGDSSHLR